MIKNNINGKIYIGQTILSIEKRFERHQKKSSKCVAIYNAIKKYGWHNFEKDWYECPDEDLNFDEELLVREMGTLSPGGYNLKEGGGSNGKWSEESKQKMSKSHIGKILSEEHKKSISESLVGIPRTDETKLKISEAHRGEKNHMYGKTLSEETKRKMSESKRGEKNCTSKIVYQYDLEGNLLGSFASVGEAIRQIVNGSKISACARGNPRYKTAGGFKWSYDQL